MRHTRLCIRGMPYMPGMAWGKVHHGHVPAPGHVALYSPRDSQQPDPAAAAIIVVDGAPFSHAMIGLRARGVPMVIIESTQADMLEDGMEVMVDGSCGTVTNETGSTTAQAMPAAPGPGNLVSLASGEGLQLLASVFNVAGTEAARACGSCAIGLLRTEFLLPPDGRTPDEAFYREAFGAIFKAATPLPVTVRLLDVSRDKIPPWLPATAVDKDTLGLHGVRLFRDKTAQRVLDAQLAALDDLQPHFDLQVLLPASADQAETGEWVGYVRQRMKQRTRIGAMSETPAAVLDMHHWFDSADFVALGCNDLMQCLFGADRDRPELRSYLDPYAPALFRLLKYAAELNAGNTGRIRLCGLLPQLHGVLPILIGAGYRAFSMDPCLVPWLAETARGLKLADARQLAMQVCEADNSDEVRQLVTNHIHPVLP